MAGKASISDSELVVLKELWNGGPGTVRAIRDRLAEQGRGWAYNTVLTLLGRLEAKRCVVRDKRGFAHVFRPAVSHERLLGQRLTQLADQLCDGTAAPLLLTLVKQHRFSKAEIAHFKELIDQLSSESKKRPRE